MNPLVQQLMALGPGVVQGLKGNGHAMQAFLESYHRQNLLMEQQERQKAMDALSQQDHARQVERQRTSDINAEQDRARKIETEKLGLVPTLGEMGGAYETPDEAKAFIEQTLPGLMKVYGQDAMGLGMPALEQATRTITARQKRQVGEYVEKALKTSYVADNPDADPVIDNLPEHITKALGKPSAKLSELQSFAQLPVGKPQGKERMPAAAGSMEEFSDPNTTPERKAQILADRKAYMQSDDRAPKVTVNTGQGAYPPQVLSRVSAITKGFDANPIVKKTQVQAEAVSFADGLNPNTKNPADDQALIYAFAKAMDPDSVVREGEYATVQKYAQSWADSFGFNAQRIFSNTAFLTPQARANMKDTIRAKFAAGRGQYENLRNEYGRRIERITGKPGGVDELTDYGGAFPGGAAASQPSTPQFKPGQKVRNKKTGEVREVTGVRPDGSPILGPVKQ